MRLNERKLLTKDLLRALLVLALVCLNFSGHAQGVGIAYTQDLKPYVVAGDGTLAVLCAQDANGDQGNHVPCHACRIGFDLALPPAPACAEPAFLALAQVHYAAPAEQLVAQPYRLVPNARGPPLA